MLTNKPISTISYNSKDFLIGTLQDLEKKRIINEWYFIHHKGEIDFFTDQREKDHFHVYIALSKKVDTEDLRDEFKQADTENPDKPLGVMPFMRSNIDDWIMYAIHDLNYLNSKGEIKEFQYSWKDIQAYNDEALIRAVKHASARAYRELFKRDYVEQYGVREAFRKGIISTREVCGMYLIEKMDYDQTTRDKLRKQSDEMNHFIDSKADDSNPFA